jgi:hypothetical protein
VNRSASFNLRDSLAATLAHVTTFHKTLSFDLEDKAEAMDRINSFIIRLSNPKNSTQWHHMLQILTRIVQVHQ